MWTVLIIWLAFLVAFYPFVFVLVRAARKYDEWVERVLPMPVEETPPVKLVIDMVREQQTAAVTRQRKLEAESEDERRSPFPDFVDEILISSETIGA